MILLSDSNGYWILVLIYLLIWLAPALILIIVGLTRRKENPELAGWLFIIAVIYLIVSFGMCMRM